MIAGGTSLVDLMKLDVERPGHLIDVTSLPNAELLEERGSLWIGATVRNSDMAHHPLTQDARAGAGPSTAVRRVAAIAQSRHDRRQPAPAHPLLLFPRHRLGVQQARSRRRLFGPRRHPPQPRHSRHERRVHRHFALEHERGAWRRSTPHLETSLERGELIETVEIPLQDWFAHSHDVKVRDRASYAFALTSAAVALDLDGDVIRDARVALGGVGTIPWRSREAENALKGRPPVRATYQAAAEAALADARPRRHNAFKVDFAKATLVRTLEELTA